MLIDWFTVCAQAVNFLLLVWLLKRFLYKPILRAIDERERRIAAQLQDAEAKKAEAQKEREDFQNKNAAFDRQRETLLGQAEADARAARERLLDEARKAADALSSHRLQALQNEERNLNQAISRRAQQEVFAITRKVLAELAGASLEERIAGVFVRRLRELNAQEKVSLASALNGVNHSALLRSAFDLPAAQRAAIGDAIKEVIGADTQFRFETVPDLVNGIELSANGYKVAWSISDCLASLEKGVSELLNQQANPHPSPEARDEHAA